jgi:hypothetical protein
MSFQKSHSFSLIFLVSVLWTITFLISPANGYASWLACYVDLMDNDEVIMNQQIALVDEARHTVELQISPAEGDELFQSSIRYPANAPSKWKIRLHPPPELQTSNMQFVVEARAVSVDGNTSEGEGGAQFTYPKMSDGRRSFGRNYNEAVTLELNGKADSVELWAGWATGFGVVSMTPKMVLSRQGSGREEEL